MDRGEVLTAKIGLVRHLYITVILINGKQTSQLLP